MCIDSHLNTETTQTCENGVILASTAISYMQVTEIKSKTPEKPLTIHYTKDVFSNDMEC